MFGESKLDRKLSKGLAVFNAYSRKIVLKLRFILITFAGIMKILVLSMELIG